MSRHPTSHTITYHNGDTSITGSQFLFFEISGHISEAIDSEDVMVSICGNYDPETTDGGDRTLLYLGDGGQLYYPTDTMSIKSFCSYFRLSDGLSAGDQVHSYVINSGDAVVTGNSDEITGEVNMDSYVSISDVTALIDYLLSGTWD